MKRILTREERDRRVKRNQLIIGGVLIFLMIFSTLGYALTGNVEDENEIVEHKGLEFSWIDGYWRFSIEGYDFFTEYNPQEVEYINFFNHQTLQNYVGKPLYFVGEASEPFYELSRNLDPFVERFNFACLDDNCSGDFPIKNCSEDNVIVIREIDYSEEGNEGLVQEENCVFIEASLANQTRYADAYLFSLLGIR